MPNEMTQGGTSATPAPFGVHVTLPPAFTGAANTAPANPIPALATIPAVIAQMVEHMSRLQSLRSDQLSRLNMIISTAEGMAAANPGTPTAINAAQIAALARAISQL